jgi:hypothetical protein
VETGQSALGTLGEIRGHRAQEIQFVGIELGLARLAVEPEHALLTQSDEQLLLGSIRLDVEPPALPLIWNTQGAGGLTTLP